MVALLYKSDMTTGVATICDTYYFITGQRQMLVWHKETRTELITAVASTFLSMYEHRLWDALSPNDL